MPEPITLEILEGPDWAVDDHGWEHYAYTLRLARGEATMDTPWKQGTGITDDPDPATVLDAMLMDAASILNARGFEDWAQEYGYDTDSRRAEAIFHACDEQTEQLRDLLGDDFDEAVFPSDHELDASTIAKRLAEGYDIGAALTVENDD